MKIRSALLLAAFALAAAGCSTMKVDCDSDREYNFSAIGTYQWIDGPAEILGEPDTYIHDDIHDAINARLVARGFRQVDDAARADVQVAYYVKLKEQTEYTAPDHREESGFTGGFVFSKESGGWKYREREPDINAYAVELGLLTVLMYDARSGERIWRGNLQTKLDRSQSEEKQRERIQAAAQKLMAELPPPQVMHPELVMGGAAVAVALLFLACRAAAAVRRSRLFALPPLPEWLPVLRRTCPIVAGLSPDEQRRLFGCMHVFLAGKKFEGCGGLRITEPIRLTVAAQACLLLVGRADRAVYPRLKTILIYPGTYRDGPKGLFNGEEKDDLRLGESWDSGVVVLSWRSVVANARNASDGLNVVYHEFAHQLDQENGAEDGMPRINDPERAAAWVTVFTREFEALCAKTEQGRRDVLDSYGATHPVEFFAVATEAFFEKPRQLRVWHPELYAELQNYYRVDPSGWMI